MIQSLLFMAGGLPAQYWFRTFQSSASPCGIATGPSNKIHYLVTTGGSSLEYGTLDKYGSSLLAESKTFDYGSTSVSLVNWDSAVARVRLASPISDDGSGNPAVVGSASYNSGDPDFWDFTAATSKVASSVVNSEFSEGAGSEFFGSCIDAATGTPYVGGSAYGRLTLAKTSGTPWAYRSSSAAFKNIAAIAGDGTNVFVLERTWTNLYTHSYLMKFNASTGALVGYLSDGRDYRGLAVRGGFVYLSGDSFVAKLNATTMALQWVKTLPSGYACFGVAPDSSGNVYAFHLNNLFPPDPGAALYKFNSSGTVLWVRNFSTMHPLAVRVDSDDVPVVMMCPHANSNNPPTTNVTVVARVAADGSGTGSYTLGTGTTYPTTYSSVSPTPTAGSLGSFGSTSISSTTGYSQSSGSVSDAGNTFTSTKKDIA